MTTKKKEKKEEKKEEKNYFKPKELKCKATGEEGFDPDFLALLK